MTAKPRMNLRIIKFVFWILIHCHGNKYCVTTPLGTPLNDEEQNWRLNQHFTSTKSIGDRCLTSYGVLMCGLIPHYDEEMAGEKFDFQPNHAGRPGFSSAI